MSRTNVQSSASDYTTANGPEVKPPLNETQKAALYAELASGAETGWDYTMRWFQVGKLSSGLLALNVRNTIAVDLNSILCTSSAKIFCSVNRGHLHFAFCR